MDRKTSINEIVIILMLVVIAFGIFFSNKPRKIQIVDVDTVRFNGTYSVKIDPIKFKNVPATIDSSGQVKIATASVIQKTGEYSDTLFMQYIFPPISSFNGRIGLQERLLKIDTIVVDVDTESVTVESHTDWTITAIITGSLLAAIAVIEAIR